MRRLDMYNCMHTMCMGNSPAIEDIAYRSAPSNLNQSESAAAHRLAATSVYLGYSQARNI